MVFAIIVAVALLCLSAALIFGAPWLLFGRAAVAGAGERPDVRMLGGALATALIVAALAPMGAAALISGSETALVLAQELNGLSFGL